MKFKSMISAFLALIVTLGMAVVGLALTAAPASAHTGDLGATATCQPDGTYLVTYTLTTAQTDLTGTTYWKVGTVNFEVTPSSWTGLGQGPITTTGQQTITLGTTTVPGTSTKAPWAYAFTKWSDSFTKGSDGGDIDLEGTCKPADKLDAAAAVTTTSATCLAGETLVYGAISNAVFSGTANGTKGAGSYAVVATANSGHKFANGDATKSFSGSLAGPLTGLQCAGPIPADKVTTKVVGTPACGATTIATTITTTSWVLDGSTWVPGTPVITSGSRALTPDEIIVSQGSNPSGKCYVAPPTTKPLVVHGEFGGAEPTCANRSVEWTRTVTTTTYSYAWDAVKLVWVETKTPVNTIDSVTQTKALTTDQINACSLNLTLMKKVTSHGPYFAESNVTYRLVPHNDGPATAKVGWSVTEVLPAGATLVWMSGVGYTCNGLVCVSLTTLAPGADGMPITVVAKIPADESNSFKNVAYVSPSKSEVPETNPLVVPNIKTDTTTSRTDNDAQAIVTVLPPETKGITITLPNTGTTIPLTWLLAATGILAAGVILLGASRFTTGGRKK